MNDILQPGQHPDAEQLNAFTEHALPVHEQQQMLAHLAACPDCRAMVYLAQQADPTEAPESQAAATRRPWFSGWLSGWGLSIPATAIACLILLSLYLRKTPTAHNQTTTTTTASIRQAQPLLPATTNKPLIAAASPGRVLPRASHALRREKTQHVATEQLTATASVTTPAQVALASIARAPDVQEAQVTPRTVERVEIMPTPTLKIQSSNNLSGGGITGTVTDPQGKVIVKAQVTATNTDTGIATTRQTTNEGVYAFNDLPVGTYKVEVVANGFQRLLQENVNVDNASMFGLNLKPPIGGGNTTITVTDAPPYLNTTDSTLGGTIENELYTSLPLTMNGGPRDPTAYQYLMPGVQQNVAQNSEGAVTAGSSGIYGGTGQTNLNQNYVEGVPVATVAVQGSGIATANAAAAGAANTLSTATSAAVLANRKPLPSKLSIIAVVENASDTLVLDTTGALFRSADAGVTWHPVPVQWQGRALSLRVTQPPSAAQQATTATNAVNAAEARQKTQTLALSTPAFELRTDSGSIYSSSDGQTWQRK